MAFSITIGGMTFTDGNFSGWDYSNEDTGMPKAMEKMVEHVANAFRGIATDSVTIGTGAKSFTVTNANSQIPAFAVGMPVRIAETADPATNFMQGVVTTWDGATGAMTAEVDSVGGAGTISAWTITVGGNITAAPATPVAVADGGTGADTSGGAVANLFPAIAGVIETNANIVAHCLVGPVYDRTIAAADANIPDWDRALGSHVTSHMLATVESTGADSELNIYDLTDSGLVGASPLATLPITGAATPRKISSAMGYIGVATEDGLFFFDPHDGSWAERTAGYPHTLTQGGEPGISSNDVSSVSGRIVTGAPNDPRTNGPLPTFTFTMDTTHIYHTYQVDGSLYKILNSPSGATQNTGWVGDHSVYSHGGELTMTRAFRPLVEVASEIDQLGSNASFPYFLGADTAFDASNQVMAAADPDGLSLGHPAIFKLHGGVSDNPYADWSAITRAYNTGHMFCDIRGAWLANSVIDNRAYQANTLNENGTVTEAAVETGAELMGYSGWSTSNYCSRGDASDYNSLGTGAVYMSCWFKCSGNSAEETYIDLSNAGQTTQFKIALTAGGLVRGHDNGATATQAIDSTATYDDAIWHKADFARRSSTNRELYVDGVLVNSGTTDTGTLTGTILLGIGAKSDSNSPASTSTLALARLSATAPSAAQIRAMYEAERGMFEEDAKSLLQSATTDAVLDVCIDPITSKVGVVQADSLQIWNGLVMEEAIAIDPAATNAEHLILFNDDWIQVNDTNISASIAALDVREELTRLAGVGAPAGVDLSKAKAWIELNGESTISVKSSHNIESVTDNGAGDYTFEFAVPFKNDVYTVAAISHNDRIVGVDGSFLHPGSRLPTSETLTVWTSGGTQADGYVFAVWHGELEGE